MKRNRLLWLLALVLAIATLFWAASFVEHFLQVQHDPYQQMHGAGEGQEGLIPRPETYLA